MAVRDDRPGVQQTPPDVRPGEPSTELSEEEELKAAKAANRFDIRRLIGGVFTPTGSC